MKVLILDNYDSFTYNLYQYVGEILHRDLSASVVVFRNNEITLDEIKQSAFDRIIISPGPGNPMDEAYFGVCFDVIKELAPSTPILGVCLGMQGIAYCFGGEIVKAKIPMHGKISAIDHDGQGVFRYLPQQLEVMRYHSLIVKPDSIPDCLKITSRVTSSKNLGRDHQDRYIGDFSTEIMAIRHKEFPLEGIQFHPESFATEGGIKMLENFIYPLVK